MKLNLNKENFTWERVRFYVKKYETVILSILVVLFLFSTEMKSCSKQKKIDALTLENKAAFLVMTTYRNSDSLHVANIEVLTSENNKQFLKMKSQDTTILKLQAVVKDYKKKLQEPVTSATVISNTTSISGTIPTNIVPSTTSVEKGGFPTYESNKTSKWIDLYIKAAHDSTHFDLKIRNEYSVVLGYDKKKPFAEVTNYNPFTETTDMRTYSVFVPKPKRISLAAHVGYGIVGAGFGPSITVGLSYDLINLW